MHQIRFRLGLCPTPHWETYSAHPDPLAGFGGRFAEGEGLGWGRGGKGEGRGVEGREWEGAQVTVEPGPLRALLRHCLSDLESRDVSSFFSGGSLYVRSYRLIQSDQIRHVNSRGKVCF